MGKWVGKTRTSVLVPPLNPGPRNMSNIQMNSTMSEPLSSSRTTAPTDGADTEVDEREHQRDGDRARTSVMPARTCRASNEPVSSHQREREPGHESGRHHRQRPDPPPRDDGQLAANPRPGRTHRPQRGLRRPSRGGSLERAEVGEAAEDLGEVDDHAGGEGDEDDRDDEQQHDG